MPQRKPRTRHLTLTLALALGLGPLAAAEQATSGSSAGRAEAPPATPARPKDVVPAGPEAAPPPAATLPAAAPLASGAAPVNAPTAAQVAFGGALGDLALHLLRAASEKGGNADSNALVSPYSVANALGMLHAGAAGETAAEISGVLEPATGRGRLLQTQMKALNQSLSAAHAGVEMVSANRVWLDQSAVSQVSKPFAASIAENYRGDGVALSFREAESAAGTINKWISETTRGRIPKLLTAANLPPTTKAVITNAVYFKGAWAQPFEPSATQSLPFHPVPGQTLQVPTMTGVKAVREGTVNNLQVLELAYGSGEFALMMAMPIRADHTLNALEVDTAGLDIVQWLSAVKPATVMLQMPKFRIEPAAAALKDALMAAGMRAPFRAGADFGPMAPKADLVLDNIYHAAGVIVDERGSEATAATAAVARSKGLAGATPPLRKVDRPFLFVIVHKPSATPLFVGRVFRPVI